MFYEIEFDKQANKDLEKLEKKNAHQVLSKIENLRDNLQGDVKKLSRSNEYRLRAGNYRILFKINSNIIKIFKISHRKDIYK